MHALLLGILACSIKDQSPGEPSGGDDSGSGYSSDFSTGQYRMSAFTILGSDEGRDWDGDGKVDNNLPNVLETFSLFVKGSDLSKGGLNEIAADAIQNDSLVLLIDANYDDVDLTLDFLAGLVDEDGNLVVDDDASYDPQGDPISRIVGTFVSENLYTAGPDPLVIPIPVDTNGTLAPFPLEQVQMDGSLGSITLDGTISGIVPVGSFVEEVLPMVVPEGGYGGLTEAELIGIVTELLNTAADVVTESGEPGISAALHFSAAATAF